MEEATGGGQRWRAGFYLHGVTCLELWRVPDDSLYKHDDSLGFGGPQIVRRNDGSPMFVQSMCLVLQGKHAF